MSCAETALAVQNLEKTVKGMLPDAETRVKKLETDVSAFINNARSGYPVFNLLANALLNDTYDNEDKLTKAPNGFYIWNSQCDIKLIVLPDPSGTSTWWQKNGNLLRVEVAPKAGATQPYCALWAQPTGVKANNTPAFKTTRGFEYRIIEASNVNARAANCGWETGSVALDLTKTYWTPVSYTGNGVQTNAIVSFHLFDHPANARLVIEMRNLFINLGESNFCTLPLRELTTI